MHLPSNSMPDKVPDNGKPVCLNMALHSVGNIRKAVANLGSFDA
jgi:hypothetical protein